jgi:hypothetical protein
MKCEKFRKNMILYLYEELDKKSAEELNDHIKKCPNCSKEMAYTKKVFDLVEETKTEDIPDADWEKCWSLIDEEVSIPDKKREKYFDFIPKWAAAAAALVCVLIIGFVIGRTTFIPREDKITLAGQDAFQISLQEYFDSLKPLLIEYAHYSGDKDSNKIIMDKKYVKELLIQNILLKRLAAEKNPDTRQLLEDIELILREITNMDKNGTSDPLMIKEYINNQGILNAVEVRGMI